MAKTLRNSYFNNKILIFLVLISASFTRGEETSYSIENNRVLKLLAKADQEARDASSTTPAPSMLSTNLTDTEYTNILNQVKQLKLIILRMQQMSHLDEQVSKCIASIKRHNEYKAKQHWRSIVVELEQSINNEPNTIENNAINKIDTGREYQDQLNFKNEKSQILRRIVIGSYEGLRPNILPIIHFINFTEIISGLHPLLQEMRDYDHVYSGNEIFLIARLIRYWCGTTSALYEELPFGIQYIDSYSVYLLNENNQGLLYYKVKTPCRGRHCTNNELFSFHHPIDDFDQKTKDKARWIFLPTNTSDSISDTNIKFYMRNGYIEPAVVVGNISDNENGTSIHAPPPHKFIDISYEYKMSTDKKSIIVVALVNHTEDAVRLRVQESHLIKRLIMGEKNIGGGTFGKLTIMGTEDRFERANDGNWVVIPADKLDSELLHDKELWNENVHCSI